ncbi:MAG: hypothetical protein A3F82_07805 [Deltaproteobacteria bacterium RIFCSPLOWO2_12_FULL_44_12]|nr:MAG: hypothetical protein A2712_10640 [Deltaproteobacteria bacterium RIFCSPHIGHO2_01_FULL_43_49]OGQ15564.1 MAG: hypothetical protein A3D22_11170 [Deltaproteobacteria bacterium RIFCSPHIGHO2_02_FULL_44_53]OGQ28506.1 MAG: hypothetical protein A3D98_03355 [Deltaproteobacteria bacterium RIFCSPHIGHO2_12_FULL_44_21]OGQ32370.1 MAG: hypothetical protein A2979_01015 [Deltaproteobacteria bacterium RIFCSPLOWO2_01_FULL_45_74]OGQ44012.1 MAG: hypothetical protein A3I70_04915 [Deltaproteobacteria bacterium 
MDLQGIQQKDLAHRLFHWADTHRIHLVLTLAGGIAFTGLLMGTIFLSEKREGAALETLVSLSHSAKQSLDNKNFEACSANYEKLYQTATRQPFYRILALHGLASCYKAQNDFKKAYEYLDRASKEPGHVEPNLSRFEAAVCLELAKDPTAETAYQVLLKESDLNPELKNKIEERYLWLQLQKQL